MEELQNWLDDLLSLQEIDSRLDRMKSLVAQAPEQKKEAQDNLDAQQTATLAAKEEVRKVELRIKDIAAQIGTIENSRNKLLDQSTSVKDNDTYRALLAEADSLKAQISDKETGELEVMEVLDEKKAVFKKCKERLKEAINHVEQMIADLDTRIDNCKEQIDVFEKKREDESSKIETEVLSLYNRLRIRKKIAIIQAHNDKCGGCHLKLTESEIKLALQQIPMTCCGNCGVLIYK